MTLDNLHVDKHDYTVFKHIPSDLLGDILKNKPVEDTSLDNVIVVDNAPKVGPDRMERLKSVLKKVFGRFGTIVTEYYPTNEEGLFKG